MSPKLR